MYICTIGLFKKYKTQHTQPQKRNINFFNKFSSENLFNLKFAAKQMERSSKKCEKDERVEKGKLKKVSFILTILNFNGSLSFQYARDQSSRGWHFRTIKNPGENIFISVDFVQIVNFLFTALWDLLVVCP